MTPGFRRALEILRDHGPLWHYEFAALMWPGRKWRSPSRGGPSGDQVAAGYLLNKMLRRGWVYQRLDRSRRSTTWALETAGRAALINVRFGAGG